MGTDSRVARVSFLVDLGAGSPVDRASVRLLVSRTLAHLARQPRGDPPRWSARFYDSARSPLEFDARLRAATDAASRRLRAREDDELGDSRLRSWVDQTLTGGSDGARGRGGRSGARDVVGGGAAPFAIGGGPVATSDFRACSRDAVYAFVRAYDEAVATYHADVSADKENAGAAARDDVAWFTTLARQMAATLQDAAESAGGGLNERDVASSLVFVLARVDDDDDDGNGGGGDDGAAGGGIEGVLGSFKGIEDALRKGNARAHILRLRGGGASSSSSSSSSSRWTRATELFSRFGWCALPAGLFARAGAYLPLCASLLLDATSSSAVSVTNDEPTKTKTATATLFVRWSPTAAARRGDRDRDRDRDRGGESLLRLGDATLVSEHPEEASSRPASA